MGDRLSDIELNLWQQWFEVTQRATTLLDELLQKHHQISLVDFEILRVLHSSPGHRRRMNEIAERVLVSRSRLTYRVDRLCDRGLLIRENDDEDRRGTNACLTPDGHGVIAGAIPDHAQAVRSILLDQVEDDELPVISSVLDRLTTTLQS